MAVNGIVGSLLGHGGAVESAIIYGDRTGRLSVAAAYGAPGVARLAKGVPYGSDLRLMEEDQRSPDEAQPYGPFDSFIDSELSSSEDSCLMGEEKNGRSNRRKRVRLRKPPEAYHVHQRPQLWKNPLPSPSTKATPVVEISDINLLETQKWSTIKRSSPLWADRSDPRIEAYESQCALNSQRAWNTQRVYDLQRATPKLPPPAYISPFCRSEPANSDGHTVTKKRSKRDMVETYRPFRYFHITDILPISLAWEVYFWSGFFVVVIATPILLVTILKVPPRFMNPSIARGVTACVESQQERYHVPPYGAEIITSLAVGGLANVSVVSFDHLFIYRGLAPPPSIANAHQKSIPTTKANSSTTSKELAPETSDRWRGYTYMTRGRRRPRGYYRWTRLVRSGRGV